MVSRLYFLIRPKPALVAKLADRELREDFGAPELWSKNEFDRVRNRRDDVLRELKTLYIRDFRRKLRIGLSDCPALQKTIDLNDFSLETFDQFWDMEVFEDCEEFERVENELTKYSWEKLTNL